jgi:para-nitrobenzyl esterase
MSSQPPGAPQVQAPQVRVRQGRLTGRPRRAAYAYLGIPYALPPTGQRRLRPAEPLPSAGDARDAGASGYAAPQTVASATDYDRCFRQLPQSEDCLWLNVWTPDPSAAAGLPVLVWLHGGAFVHGTAADPLYDGSLLASRGCVVVGVNYRLGVLGMLDLRGRFDGAVPNLALRDQAAAIGWVAENIAAFGGDPARITLFGESVGGTCVLVHLGSRLGSPVRRGIAQSGSAAQQLPACATHRVTAAVLDRVGVRSNAWDDLARVPVSRLLAAQQEVLTAVWSGSAEGVEIAGDQGVAQLTPFLPVSDGEVVDGSIASGLSRGAASIQAIIGTNSNEAALYRVIQGRQQADSWILTNLARSAASGQLRGTVETALRRYADRPGAAEPTEALETDRYFRAPSLVAADRIAAGGGECFLYRLDADGLADTPHLADFCLVFGQLRTPLAAILGVARSRRLSSQIQDTWLAFAGTGQPGPAGWERWRPHRTGSEGTTVISPSGPVYHESGDSLTRQAWDLGRLCR